MRRANFPLHWTGSSRFSLFQCARQWRLLPASELRRWAKLAAMRLKWAILAVVLMVLLALVYWLVAGHDLRYTINNGEYDEDFSTRGRIIISCLVGAFWSAIATLLLAVSRWVYRALSQQLRLRHGTRA